MNPKRIDRPTPMYRLDRFQQVFSGSGNVVKATKQALSDAITLGFDEEDIEQVVRDLRPEHFYKSMPAQRVLGAWQDVYKVQYRNIPLYIKLQLQGSGESATAVVVAFKEDESAR